MSKTNAAQANPIAHIAERHDDARRFAAEQERGKVWKTLPGARSVGFMDLRNCMCRWPISDADNSGATFYCGSPCPPEASYCEPHRQIAFVPNRARVAAPRVATAISARPV